MIQRTAALVSRNQKFIPLTATAALAVAAYSFGAILYPGMRDPQVFLNILRNNTFLLISAVGMTFVIVSGGIDLSVSGVVALVTVASAALLREGWNAWLVILLMLLMGMALGAIMGSFIAYLKVQPFIATLAGMWFARGMCFFISDDAIAIHDRTFHIIGQTRLLIPGLSDPATQKGDFISILVVVSFIVLGAAIYVAHFTRFGRALYAMGGNEQSARLMGLPVETTKVLVYTVSGFCSGLAGICWAIFVASGHGLYATGFELNVIASVVMGGTMLTGGVGYVFGTLFGVLILGITQTLIQFNGSLSSWWTRIVIGMLTFMFIGVQSILAARKVGRRRVKEAGVSRWAEARRRRRTLTFGTGAVVLVAVVALLAVNSIPGGGGSIARADVGRCAPKPFRQELAVSYMQQGAVLTYERNGGPECIDEVYGIFPDGRIVGDNGASRIERQSTSADVESLLTGIRDYGWFTEEMYNTWHTPCGQCYGYYLTVAHDGQEKTVKGVDGGTDAPADYWQVVSIVKGIVPKFVVAP